MSLYVRELPHDSGVVHAGNPTGQCLSYQNLQDIIKFAHEENIVLMADEVYQTNIYQVRAACFLLSNSPM